MKTTPVMKKAFAKVNLFLNVVGRRTDGYHDLEMINARIDLFDELTFTPGGTRPVTITSNDKFLENQNNLVYKIACHLMETYSPTSQVSIDLVKRIPAGAGLGGNSADAAAVIQGLDELFEWGLSDETMQAIALRFGADIPYCLSTRPALVEGIGERITPLDLDLSGYHVLFANPKVFVSTESVFQAGDGSGYPVYPIQPALSAARRNDVETLINHLQNGLQEITFSLSPATRALYEDLIRTLGPRGVVMTGSGSTILKVFKTATPDITRYCRLYSDKYLLSIYSFL